MGKFDSSDQEWRVLENPELIVQYICFYQISRRVDHAQRRTSPFCQSVAHALVHVHFLPFIQFRRSALACQGYEATEFSTLMAHFPITREKILQ